MICRCRFTTPFTYKKGKGRKYDKEKAGFFTGFRYRNHGRCLLYTSALLDRIIDHNGNMPDGVGIPVGNLTSQLFANIYLDALDQFIKHELGVCLLYTSRCV